MIRFLLGAATAALICLSGPTIADEVKGATAVKVKDPRRGSMPELVTAYGTATPTSSATQTASFQRDGMVSELYVEVGDQFKMGDKLLDFGASPAAVVAYEQVVSSIPLPALVPLIHGAPADVRESLSMGSRMPRASEFLPVAS